MSGAAAFAEFVNCESNELFDQFVADLELFGKQEKKITRNKNSKFLVLKDLLDRYSKAEKTKKWEKLRVAFHQCNNMDSIHYCVIVQGTTDRLLIKLSKEQCQFPRGFPIIWNPGSSMQFFGFYPKFENDDRDAFDEKESALVPDHCNEVYIGLKWSGYLGHFLAYSVSGKEFWTVASKNSPSSEFAKDGARMFAPIVESNPQLIRFMIDNHYGISAEMLSKNDQNHGYAVLEETPIVTAIGKGIKCEFIDGEFKFFDNDDTFKFINFLDHKSIVQVCSRYQLPVGNFYVLRERDPSIIKPFFSHLSQFRDVADYQSVEKLLTTFITKYPKHVKCIEGSVSHSKVAGNVLEGLILFMNGPTDDNKQEILIKKFKFPNYTIRTMLLRKLIVSCGSKMLSSSNLQEAQKWANIWCNTEEGKKLWLLRFAKVALLLNDNPELYQHKEGMMTNSPALHITLMDKVMELPQEELLGALESFRLSDPFEANIIVSLGPVGSGKSTVSKLLHEYLESIGIPSVHIDGDDLGLGGKIVNNLNQERNEFTKWQVYKCILQGKTPILSCGGGVLLAKKQISFQSELQKIFGPTFSFKLIGMYAKTGDDRIISKEYFQNIDLSIYQDSDLVDKAVRRRILENEWDLPENMKLDAFLTMIKKASSRNETIACDILKECYTIYSFPCITQDDFIGGKLKFSMDFSELSNEMKIQSKIGDTGTFSQLRLLAQVIPDDDSSSSIIRHITMRYEPDGFLFSNQELTELVQAYKGKSYTGFEVELFEETPESEQKVETDNNADLPESADEDGFKIVSSKKAKKQKRKKTRSISFTAVIGMFEAAHVTRSSGCHTPVASKLACIAMQRNEKKVTIPIQGSLDSVTYDIVQSFEDYPKSEVRILDVFAIP